MTRSRFRSLQDPDTLREFVRNLQEGIYITNADGEILDANPAFLRMFGVSSLDELKGFRAQDLFVDRTQRNQELALLTREGSVHKFEFRIRRPDGQERTVLDTCYRVQDPDTGELLMHGILIDITLRKELESQLKELTILDPLTHCHNRRYLGELEKSLEPAHTRWGVIVVDIDHFKSYNDRYGHQAGDLVLVRMGRFLKQRVRTQDAVVRLGGDEFLLLLLGEHADSTETVAQRLRTAASGNAPTPFSVGWAVRLPGERLQQTIGRADRELLAIRTRERDPTSKTPSP